MRKTAILVLLAAAAAAVLLAGAGKYLTFENIKENRDALRAFVEARYVPSVALFVVVYVSTAFFVPGAAALTMAGGFLFGVVEAALYVNVGGTAGALCAFALSRRLAGHWVQRRYAGQLEAFNEELEKRGRNYLLTLRIVPVFPFFLVNYFAGLTRVPLRQFLWTTSLGMFPGSFVYAFAGRQIGSINSPREALSAEMFLALSLLALIVLCPAFRALAMKMMRRISDRA